MSDVARQALNDTTDMVEKTTALIKSILELLYKGLSEREKTAGARKLLNYDRKENIKKLLGYKEAGGKYNLIPVNDISAKRFAKMLDDANIAYWPIDVAGRDEKYFMVRECDSSEVNEVKQQFLITMGRVPEVSMKDMVKANFRKTLGCIKGLDDVQTETLRHYARMKNCTIAVDSFTNGLNNVYFKESDKEKMQGALLQANWDLTGFRGETTREQKQYDIKNMDAIYTAVREGKKDIYITAAYNSNDVIKITDEGFDFKGKSFSKEDPSYDVELYRKLQLIQQPVLLTKQEYELEDALREQIVKERNKRPYFSKETKELMEKERQIRELIEEKMTLTSNADIENFSSLYNGEVSFSEFFAHDVVNDEHEIEEQDLVRRHIKEALVETSAYEIDNVFVNTKDLDSLIAGYRSEAHSKDEKERDREREF